MAGKFDLIVAKADGGLKIITDKIPREPPGDGKLVEWGLQKFCMGFEVSFPLS